MKCNNCNFEVPPDAKYCPNCGKKIEEKETIKSSICIKCHTPISVEALFCPNCGEPVRGVKKRPQIGDYYYTDGTYSHEKDPSKIVAGIVFSTETTNEEKAHGWTHGQIVATQFARMEVMRTENYGFLNLSKRQIRILTDDLLFCHADTLPLPYPIYDLSDSQIRNDKDGYIYTYSVQNDNKDFELFNAARQYPCPLPERTSGWYVPTMGQIIDMLENIIGEKIYWERAFGGIKRSSSSKRQYGKAITFLRKMGYTKSYKLASSTQGDYVVRPNNPCGCLTIRLDPDEYNLWISGGLKGYTAKLLPVAAF